MYYSNCESIKKNPKNCILKNDGFHGIEPSNVQCSCLEYWLVGS